MRGVTGGQGSPANRGYEYTHVHIYRNIYIDEKWQQVELFYLRLARRLSIIFAEIQ